MQKKLLLICESFPPQFAPRMGYLVKNLKVSGWETYVVAADDNSGRGGMDELVGYAKEIHFISQKKHRRWNLLHVLNLFWPFDYLRGEYDLRRKALTIASCHKFDVVLASISFGFFPAYSAFWVAKKSNLPFVLDIRDIGEQCGIKIRSLRRGHLIDYIWDKVRFISRFYRNRLIRKADSVISISEWHCEFLKKYNENVYLIYNGFDNEVFKTVDAVPTDVFTVLYMGTLGNISFRDPSLLFRAVAKLKNEREINAKNFRIKFYCGDVYGGEVAFLADQMKIRDLCDFLDFIPVKEVPRLIQSASLLLVLTNKSGADGPQGTLTTKFFEYLAVNRQILCVRSDETCLERAINETHSGLSGRSVIDVYNFLKGKIVEWRNFGVVKGTTDMGMIAKYSRQFQAQQFVDIFNITCKKRDGHPNA